MYVYILHTYACMLQSFPIWQKTVLSESIIILKKKQNKAQPTKKTPNKIVLQSTLHKTSVYMCICAGKVINLEESFRNRIYMTVFLYDDLTICYSLCDFLFL